MWDSYVSQARQSNHAHRRNELSLAGKLGAWRRWKREAAIIERLPEVRRIAVKVQQIFTHVNDLDELIQAGCVGLTAAANTYRPSVGAFAPYAYFRVRGAMIDSQKRRPYREAQNVSLQAIAQSNDGWLPPKLDTDGAQLPDEMAAAEELRRMLASAIAGLPVLEREALRHQLAGDSLAATAKAMGRSLAATRVTLAEARERVGSVVRGETT